MTPVAGVVDTGVATGVVDAGGKFAAAVINTGDKFATGINNTSETGSKICRRWCTLTCEYLSEFSKKFETVLFGFSGALLETDS